MIVGLRTEAQDKSGEEKTAPAPKMPRSSSPKTTVSAASAAAIVWSWALKAGVFAFSSSSPPQSLSFSTCSTPLSLVAEDSLLDLASIATSPHQRTQWPPKDWPRSSPTCLLRKPASLPCTSLFFSRCLKHALLTLSLDSTQKNPDDIVITLAVRTPLAKGKKGGFKDTDLDYILWALLKQVIEKSKIDPSLVEDICLGNVSRLVPPGDEL